MHLKHHWQRLLHVQRHWKPLQHLWQHLLHVQLSIIIGSLFSVIGSIYCMFSIMGSLSSIIGSIYSMSSIINSIYCTSSVIYSTVSSGSFRAFLAFKIIGTLFLSLDASTASFTLLHLQPHWEHPRHHWKLLLHLQHLWDPLMLPSVSLYCDKKLGREVE